MACQTSKQNRRHTELEPNQHAALVDTTQTNNLGGGVQDLRPLQLLTLGLGPPLLTSPITSPSRSINLNSFDNTNLRVENVTYLDCSRKRLRFEIGKFGRNIKQRLCCGHFERNTS